MYTYLRRPRRLYWYKNARQFSRSRGMTMPWRTQTSEKMECFPGEQNSSKIQHNMIAMSSMQYICGMPSCSNDVKWNPSVCFGSYIVCFQPLQLQWNSATAYIRVCFTETCTVSCTLWWSDFKESLQVVDMQVHLQDFAIFGRKFNLGLKTYVIITKGRTHHTKPQSILVLEGEWMQIFCMNIILNYVHIIHCERIIKLDFCLRFFRVTLKYKVLLTRTLVCISNKFLQSF